jgi:hypothetical protein
VTYVPWKMAPTTRSSIARHGIDAVLRVLRDPERFMGCTLEDGSDAKSMWPNPEWDKPDA